MFIPDMDDGRPDLVFDAGRVDHAALRDAVAKSGCFLLRNLFDREVLGEIRHRAAMAAQAWDFMVERQHRVDGYEGFVAGAYQAGHLPEGDVGVEFVHGRLMDASAFASIADGVFGAATRDYALRRSFLGGKPKPLAYHQDGFFVSEPGYNFWTPLNEAGRTSASLEVVVGSGDPIFAHNVIAEDINRIKLYVVARYGVEAVWHPIVRAGDALVFTTYMMHRSYSLPEMTEVRYSLEIRGTIKDSNLQIAGVMPGPPPPVITSLEQFDVHAEPYMAQLRARRFPADAASA